MFRFFAHAGLGVRYEMRERAYRDLSRASIVSNVWLAVWARLVIDSEPF
jgi:hypothetical protein